MARTPRKAGLDIVVRVTDNDDNLRGRFLISAGSLYYFRKNAKAPSRRYSWRQLIEMIEEQPTAKRTTRKVAAKPAAAKPAGAKPAGAKARTNRSSEAKPASRKR
ncbi:hypothetical protein [Wenzhouxiangella sp. XN24]|uniref:hypothetical protein n=1 Tax=Wenzhouxiangella sp. XN24 TaxID=2713569 RepID=UPI0013EC3FCB|nr:hypothetical protein [Wenzhouxiangella sp. XN24]NGX15275.1 hypothetical protein [Wenzhouxiangella sp. XN24]